MYGLSGASRSGKSSLAKHLSTVLEIPYVDSSTTVLMREAGFNPVAAMDIDTRIKAQEHLFQAYQRLLDRQPPAFITDRTPIDMLAYMLGEVTMHNTTEAQGEKIADYVDRCVAATESRFALVVVTLPLKTYEAAPDKPPPSKGYQSLIHTIISGALRNSHCPTLHLDPMSLESRANVVVDSLVTFRQAMSERNAAEVFH